ARRDLRVNHFANRPARPPREPLHQQPAEISGTPMQHPPRIDIPLDDITGCIINAAMQLHSTFQNGMLESAYELMLARALQQQGFDVRRQHPASFVYDNIHFNNAFRVDLLVHETVVVEIKSVQHLKDVHHKQLLTYLRLMQLQVGLLINFGEERLKDGLHRIVNKLDPSQSPLLRVNNPPGRSS
ncbi:MAG: GxxExxY protein, partial [Gemmatimonadaceae bacterium]